MISDQVTRPILSDEQLAQMTKEDLMAKYKQLDTYVNQHEAKSDKQLAEIQTQKSFEIAKLKNIILMKYVTGKSQPREEPQLVREKTVPEKQLLTFVDPSVNAIIVQLKKELDEARKKKDELQMELDSWKFNPESHMSKRLMAKCRKLLKENEDLGKIISSGNVAQLEHDLAYHKEILNEACENEQNINSFLSEMDNEMDAMQSTILHLSRERDALVKAKEAIKEKSCGDTEQMNTNE